jgi:16S rRNA (guanine1207-N2)-methyltransferase
MALPPRPAEPEEIRAELLGQSLRFQTTWGLFSPREIDEGSALLLAHLKVAPSDVTIDLGCGYGALGVSIAKACPQGRVLMLDKDFVAVEYAQRNAALNGLSNCEVRLSNGLADVQETIAADTLVSNLPAKVGRELMTTFLLDAYAQLKPGGQIVVVTINGLREYIKKNFQAVFGNYEKLKQGKTYTVSRAIKSL